MKLKILFIGNFLSKAGTNPTYEETLAQKMTECGFVIVQASRYRNKIARFLDMIAAMFSTRGSYQAVHISVFSGSALIWAETTAFLAKKLGKKIILALHGGALPAFSKRYPKRVYRLLNCADAVISPSAYLNNALQAFSKKPIQIIPNAIEINKYPFRRRDGVKPRLIWLRAFHDIYNPLIMPNVIKLLKNDYPDIRLTMIGPDKGDGTFSRVKELVRGLGLNQEIEILSGISKDQVPSKLNSADIFINSTNVDNTPISVIEAMACGLCIVSTNVGGISNLLNDHKDALLVSPNNPEKIILSVRKILSDNELASQLSQNARTKAESFDWDQVFPQWDALFQSFA